MSPRSSLDDGTTSVRSYSRSRNGSLSQPGMDLSDGDMSTYGGMGASGDEDDDELDDEDDQLLADLRADDIPVTGFAVASNKRNADFHDLFPNVPEGDYLIEGAFVAKCSSAELLHAIGQTTGAHCSARS